MINPTDLLVQQFRDKPRICAKLNIFAAAVQEIEDCFNVDLLSIDDSEGVQLDNISVIVGAPERHIMSNGSYSISDVDYRLLLKAQIIINHSCGEPELIIKLITTYTKCNKVIFSEPGPAFIQLIICGAQYLPSDLLDNIMRCKAGGVALMASCGDLEDNLFRFDIGKGFSEFDGSYIGGTFTEELI